MACQPEQSIFFHTNQNAEDLLSPSVYLFFSVLCRYKGEHRVPTVWLSLMWLNYIFEFDDPSLSSSSVSRLLVVQHASSGSLSETTDLILTLLMIWRGSKIASKAIKSFQDGATTELVYSLGGDSGDSKQQ